MALRYAITMVLLCAAPFAASLCRSVQGDVGEPALPERSFFEHCAFVCVDVQPGRKHRMSPDRVPEGWRQQGATADDVNEAVAYTFDVAHPNAARVAEACGKLGLPRIFVHWGYQFRDGMDLDPAIRRSFLVQFGKDYQRWPHHISRSDSRPAEILGVKPGDYVIAKTGQDAFSSSSLGFLLENLGVKRIVFAGGHTGACLGRTATSAKKRGYRILCVQDATFAAWQSRRAADIRATGYDYVLTREQFEKLILQ